MPAIHNETGTLFTIRTIPKGNRGFIDNTIFETKLGDLGTLLSFSGIEPDCRADEALDAFTRRYESAMRLFDDRFRAYSYIVKRSGATPPLCGAVRSFQFLTDDLLAPKVLYEREARLFLRNLVNYDPTHAAAFHCEPGERLDQTTLDSQVEVYADHLRVNDFFVKSISLKQLPAQPLPTCWRTCSRLIRT